MTTEPNQNLVISKIYAYGEEMILACDGKCDKAWGVVTRPTISLDPDDDDDVILLSDEDLGIAPINPGIAEGDHYKPQQPVHNKWCFRQCERSDFCEVSEFPHLKLPDWSQRRYNIPGKRQPS